MLKLAWYLVTDPDYWTGLTESPRLPQAPEVSATLAELFGDDAGFSAAHTATAVEIMLRMAEHLSDAIPHAPITVTDRTQLAPAATRAQSAPGTPGADQRPAGAPGRHRHRPEPVRSGGQRPRRADPESGHRQLPVGGVRGPVQGSPSGRQQRRAPAGTAMSTGDLAAQIGDLRAETIAAVEQRQLLAINARKAVIAAVNDGLICRAGADEALAGWGLPGLPGAWTVSAQAPLTYTRLHTDETDARDNAVPVVRAALLAVLGARVWVSPMQVVAAEVVPGEGDHPGSRPYRITVQLGTTTRVTATSPAEAVLLADAVVQRHQPELDRRDLALGERIWTVTDGPDPVCVDPDIAAWADTGAVRLPDTGDDRGAATAARDTAVGDLANLRRMIRATAIAALVDGELSGDHEQAAGRVEGFLRDLGLAALPRAHHTTVVADLKLLVRAATGNQARDAVRDGMRTAIATGPCACRKSHPGSSSGMLVLVEGASETIASMDVEAGDLVQVGDRRW